MLFYFETLWHLLLILLWIYSKTAVFLITRFSISESLNLSAFKIFSQKVLVILGLFPQLGNIIF